MVLVAKPRDEQAVTDARRFGERLRVLRTRAHLTQAALADKLGMDYQAVSRLERGGSVPNWSTVKRVALAVGVTPDDFLSAEEWVQCGLDAASFLADETAEDE